MKGTTGQKQRPKQTQKRNPGARTESPNSDHPRWRLVSILFNLNGVPRFGTIKRRENETIPIWNLIVALAEDSGGQWSRFSWTPSVRSWEKKIILHRSSFSPKTRLTYLSQSVVKFHRVIWTIPRNNKYMKKPQNLITLDFCLEHGSRTNKKENQQHKM